MNFVGPITPKTLLRRIDGNYYYGDYKLITGDVANYINSLEEKLLIIKPSIGGSSGKGISFYHKENGVFKESESGAVLDSSYLEKNVADQFVMQAVLRQTAFMSQFNPTSINTIRVATYRSVKTNKIECVGLVMRIGAKGKRVDNGHAGGCFVSVNQKGELGKWLCDSNGNKYTEFNGVDFSRSRFAIPDFANVLDFAKKVAECIPHVRLLGLDIAIDINNEPKLIEYNVTGFSPWLFQFTGGPVFGPFTDEVIEYCKHRKREASRIFVTF